MRAVGIHAGAKGRQFGVAFVVNNRVTKLRSVSMTRLNEVVLEGKPDVVFLGVRKHPRKVPLTLEVQYVAVGDIMMLLGGRVSREGCAARCPPHVLEKLLTGTRAEKRVNDALRAMVTAQAGLMSWGRARG